MPVYNGEKHLREAIESILGQTFSDFEFLIINDASTDSSRDIILSYKDSRIKLIDNEENLGLSASINKGIKLAQGQYIARMDADDISLPKRFQKQVEFMDRNPDIGVCGSWAITFGRKFKTVWRHPIHHAEIKAGLIFNSYVVHPSIILRKNIFDSSKIMFDESLSSAVDYNLWVKIIDEVNFHNIPEALLYYRIHKNQMTKTTRKEQVSNASKARIRQLEKLGLAPSDKDIKIIEGITNNNHNIIDDFYLETNNLFLKILKCNKKHNYLGQNELQQFLCNTWIFIMEKSGFKNFYKALFYFVKSKASFTMKVKAIYSKFLLKYLSIMRELVK